MTYEPITKEDVVYAYNEGVERFRGRNMIPAHGPDHGPSEVDCERQKKSDIVEAVMSLIRERKLLHDQVERVINMYPLNEDNYRRNVMDRFVLERIVPPKSVEIPIDPMYWRIAKELGVSIEELRELVEKQKEK